MCVWEAGKESPVNSMEYSENLMKNQRFTDKESKHQTV